MPEINLVDHFDYYVALPHQQEAIQLLQQAMPDSLLQKKAAWYRKWADQPPTLNPLPVEYMWQRDNYDGYGDRECQTSSIAMALKYLGIKGIDTDDDYLRIVNRYGDTTDQATHMKALGFLGVPSRFATTLNRSDVIRQIEDNKPIPCGIVHKGSADNPVGSGHYICVIGFTEDDVIAHDPFGQLCMATGTWIAAGPEDGKGVHYSWENFLKRWDIGGGWGWLF
jgi:hypothetical protein|tara:strand:- start:202 stop:873 length:672 start_codon:yes stop_codon:yes gene_type:complete